MHNYNEITGWFENPVREQRRHAAALRKQGHWNYLNHKPLDQWTPRECAEMFAPYITWSFAEHKPPGDPRFVP